MKIKNTGQAQIFKSPFLERLTKTSPGLTLATYVPPIFFLLYRANEVLPFSGLKLFSWYMGGLLFWTLFEYFAHRYLFHWISENPSVQKFHYTIHGVHHEFPRDEERVFMPPVPGLILMTLIFSICWLFLGNNAYAFFPGMLSGYLAYVFMHYSIHKFRAPKWLKPLWDHHTLHHYKCPDKAFGVSSRFWDYVFGSMPPKN